ncbi:Rieske (2Fe-2S) protein [Alteribacillus persepolensis]|nr:Rieske (2Fe-2S) protein [Alteribacillus persepolensis]
MRNVLCKRDEIPPGDKKIFQVKKTSIVVVRKEDKFFAIRNGCPHQGAELGKGSLGGAAPPSDVKEYCYEKQGEVLYCPWHHWSFDVETGCSVYDEKIKVKTYDVKVEGDDVVLYA